jgi:hypothetical protein
MRRIMYKKYIVNSNKRMKRKIQMELYHGRQMISVNSYIKNIL